MNSSFADELARVRVAVAYYERAMSRLRISDEHPEIASYYGLDRASERRLRFRSLFFATRLEPVLAELGEGLRVLDLGCGYALESHLLASTGAALTALDGSHLKIERARRVGPLWRSVLDDPGEPRLEEADLRSYTPEAPFDVVYSSATLHHIEPVEEAAHAVAGLLRPGGLFFLGEENAASPVQQLAVQRKIGWRSSRVQRRVHPRTGEVTWYGRENIRTASAWRRIFRTAGFEAIGTRYCRFLPPLSWRVERLLRVERGLRRLPGLRALWAIGFVQGYRRVG